MLDCPWYCLTVFMVSQEEWAGGELVKLSTEQERIYITTDMDFILLLQTCSRKSSDNSYFSVICK